MNNLKYLILFILSVLVNNFSFGQRDIDILLSRLDSIIEKHNIPGAMISIVRSDSTIYQGGVGYANIANKEEVTDKHLFRIGSITKSITALGFLHLVSKGKVSLNTTIDEIDNTLNFSNPWKDKHPITVEQILEHTAGFDEMHNHARNNNNRYDQSPSGRDLVHSHRKSLYTRWKPGERWAYSNPGYALAGHLMEKITNQPYSQYLKEEILNPIGMGDSEFLFKNNPELLIAQGYIREGGQLNPISFKSILGGAAGDLCSNAQDMALFLRYMLNRKTVESNNIIIEPELLDRMENPQTSIAAKNGHKGGYGLANAKIWSNNYLFHGHDGGIDGFSSMYLYSQEADLGLAVSINIQGKIWKVLNEILRFYLGKNEYDNSDAIPIPDEVKKKYTGYYNFKSPRVQTMYFLQKPSTAHVIEFENDKLLVKDFTGAIRDSLIHKGNSHYYRRTENLPLVSLIENENNTPILWLGNEYYEKGSQAKELTKVCILVFSVLIVLLNFLFGIFGWLILKLKKDQKPRKNRTILWLASLSFVIMIISFILTTELYEVPETINIGSVILCLSSVVFLLCSIYSLIKTLKGSGNNFFFRRYYRLSAISLCIIAFWFLSNNLIGFMMWAY